MTMIFKILEIRIDNLSKREIKKKILLAIFGNKFCQISTINPEIILEAKKNKTLKKILNATYLNIVDGIGIKFAFFWKFKKKLKFRWAGADLMCEILNMANDKNLKVFLIAKKSGLSKWKETADTIKTKYPRLIISGLDYDNDYNLLKKKIKEFNPCIVFCSLGAPEQEIVLEKIGRNHKNKIKIAIGVGGSFDFITKKIKRAPKFLRKTGLEWLWRLLQQPHRIKRIFRAVILFPLNILFERKFQNIRIMK